MTAQITSDVLQIAKNMETRSYWEPLGDVATICPFSKRPLKLDLNNMAWTLTFTLVYRLFCIDSSLVSLFQQSLKIFLFSGLHKRDRGPANLDAKITRSSCPTVIRRCRPGPVISPQFKPCMKSLIAWAEEDGAVIVLVVWATLLRNIHLATSSFPLSSMAYPDEFIGAVLFILRASTVEKATEVI